jgi:hypothetical protein
LNFISFFELIFDIEEYVSRTKFEKLYSFPPLTTSQELKLKVLLIVKIDFIRIKIESFIENPVSIT